MLFEGFFVILQQKSKRAQPWLLKQIDNSLEDNDNTI